MYIEEIVFKGWLHTDKGWTYGVIVKKTRI